MHVADDILKKNNARGILVGGLATAVWNKKRTDEELTQHKDVDVYVLDETFVPESFEGGVDWWTQNTQHIVSTNTSGIGYIQGYQTWGENGNGVVLTYAFQPNVYYENYGNLSKPGLYILDSEYYINLKLEEAAAHTDIGALDNEIIESYKRKVGREVKKMIMPVIAKDFEGKIISERHWRGEYSIAKPVVRFHHRDVYLGIVNRNDTPRE